ncbi:MAG TPA: sigma-54 dependent transcriptional regulator [Vicinamibacteria bacterium]|nr:sigma-54 dependent transcriptional regulator [Vicinamibacteria bacterium]
MSSAARGTVLLVDDEPGILKTLGRALAGEGHEVVTTSSALEAQKLLADRAFDVFVCDHRMPGKTGLELIRQLAASLPEAERPQVVMMTAHATVENAIEAMKLGAYDYLQKPFEVEELLVAVGRALEEQSLRRQHRYLLSERDEEFDHYGIVGRSRVMQEVIHKLERVAQSKSTVLITGETGTGKELAARAIHARSAQADRPLIKVNCAAIPETLIESELFGHVRGAFTGATANRRGRFALADGGTIFLDEIATLGQAVQAKLLRVLQEREFEPVGAERTQKVEVRVIAASNRDLRAMVAEGRLQEDLYYRLSVIPIVLPPLRERPEDVPLLLEHFLRKHAQRLGRRVDGFEPAVLDRLRSYHWPGNVRELENTVERAVVLASGPVIDAAAVSMVEPAPGAAAAVGLPSRRLHENVEWAEQESVRRALRAANGVKKDAAGTLGISQRALSYYLAKYRID